MEKKTKIIFCYASTHKMLKLLAAAMDVKMMDLLDELVRKKYKELGLHYDDTDPKARDKRVVDKSSP
jgi:hypothetical protein